LRPERDASVNGSAPPFAHRGSNAAFHAPRKYRTLKTLIAESELDPSGEDRHAMLWTLLAEEMRMDVNAKEVNSPPDS
jgi:hypothetical protein